MRSEKDLWREMQTLSKLALRAAEENENGRPGAGKLQFDAEREMMKLQGHLALRSQVKDYKRFTKTLDVYNNEEYN